METSLDKYDNSWYTPGGSSLKRFTWYFFNVIIFQSGLFPINGLKVFLLRIFGAKMGSGIVIKPSVNIKYPWKLTVGNHCWIGEMVWIDNLAEVVLGNNVCISQGAMLLTGNHDYKSPTFDLMVKKIQLEDGVWIGAQSLVGPGVVCKSHSVLSAKSMASKDLEPYTIYAGIPALEIKKREIL